MVSNALKIPKNDLSKKPRFCIKAIFEKKWDLEPDYNHGLITLNECKTSARTIRF